MRQLILLAIVFSISVAANAQSVAINKTGAVSSDSTAMLEIRNTSKSKLRVRSNSFNDTTQLELGNYSGATTGTGILFTSAGEEGLFVSSVSDVASRRIDSILSLRFANGKIFMGINVKTPQATLHVHDNNSSISTINITNTTTGSSTNSGLAVYQSGNQAYIMNREASFLNFGSSNTVYGSFNASGNFNLGFVGATERLGLQGNIQLGSSNKGIMLDAQDRPMLTRGFDAFTSGNYTGLGRWGLFMEPSRLTLGMPAGIGGKGVEIAKYNLNSSRETLLTVTDEGKVNRPVTGSADLLPYAYGTVEGATATVLNGSGNFSVVRFGAGSYGVYFANGVAYTENVFTVLVTVLSSTTPMFSQAYQGLGSPEPLIIRLVPSSGALTDRNFSFVVYKPQ